jgi:uncharacterized membrane protein YciS (DUF1049 family)
MIFTNSIQTTFWMKYFMKCYLFVQPYWKQLFEWNILWNVIYLFNRNINNFLTEIFYGMLFICSTLLKTTFWLKYLITLWHLQTRFKKLFGWNILWNVIYLFNRNINNFLTEIFYGMSFICSTVLKTTFWLKHLITLWIWKLNSNNFLNNIFYEMLFICSITI